MLGDVLEVAQEHWKKYGDKDTKVALPFVVRVNLMLVHLIDAFLPFSFSSL
jgi:hypothetical protein